MNSERHTKVSKYLSRIRRVAPDAVGLTLEAGGWVRVADLLRACGEDRLPRNRRNQRPAALLV